MYQNASNLKLGEDYYNLNTGEYLFTYVFDGKDRVEIPGYSVPLTVTSRWSESEYDTWAYDKTNGKAYDEDDTYDICQNNLVAAKERLDELAEAKAKIQSIIDAANINEPFIFENGALSVGKEHVLSAHIQAGYHHGWISSSICW